MSSHKPVPQVYDGVSTEDVPSAGFGWSRISRSGVQIAGWISVIFMIGFNFGNHKGHVETVWLVALTVLLVVGLLIFTFEPKLKQERTITSNNKPADHLERDWIYDQKTVSGAYTELTDSQLRALNIEPSRVAHLRVDSASDAAEVSSGKHAL